MTSNRYHEILTSVLTDWMGDLSTDHATVANMLTSLLDYKNPTPPDPVQRTCEEIAYLQDVQTALDSGTSMPLIPTPPTPAGVLPLPTLGSARMRACLAFNQRLSWKKAAHCLQLHQLVQQLAATVPSSSRIELAHALWQQGREGRIGYRQWGYRFSEDEQRVWERISDPGSIIDPPANLCSFLDMAIQETLLSEEARGVVDPAIIHRVAADAARNSVADACNSIASTPRGAEDEAGGKRRTTPTPQEADDEAGAKRRRS